MVYHLGLTGFPLEQSLSPRIHAAALNACSLRGEYSLFPIPPGDPQALSGLLVRIRTGEIHGLNVTIPHKQSIIQFLDELTPVAQSIGAVNTIYLRDNKLTGDNTDASGFSSDLKKFLAATTHSHRDSQALILGAGGSARAVVYALLRDGWNVSLAARRTEQARQLADFFTGSELAITDLMFSDITLPDLSLIVNTTPIGMVPNIDQSPWPANLLFPPHAAIYDLVYNPRETKLLSDAHLHGIPATTGLGMLIEQAALAFEIWTGHRPLLQVLFDAVNQAAH